MEFERVYETSGVCTDTRNIKKDCLFICLKGERFNGNTFSAEALKAGAKYVIVDEAEYATQVNIFLVPNALEYLQQLANFHRNRFSIPIVGITGSNGKTTSKELIASVLEQKFNVHYTQGNLNNHIGVPLTLLGLNENHEIAVIEMGANKFGDIAELCAIAEPTHGIITNIGKAHLEGFINFEGVLETKKEMYDSVERSNGVLFVNADDEILTSILPASLETKTYGTKKADVIGELLALTPFVKMNWKTNSHQSETIETQMIGKYNFYNFLAAICIGRYFEVNEELISKAITSYAPTNNRSQISKTDRNTLILDAYNANPTSMKSALESFQFIDHPNKFVILGDMYELGNESATEHQKIMDLLQEFNLKGICIGSHFSETKNNSSEIVCFRSKEDYIQTVEKTSIHHALILLKGSRGIGLESIVPYL